MSKKFGFGHVNTYARKTSAASKGKGNSWSAKSVFNEASRVAENSPHVVNPQPPQTIHGVSPEQLEKMLDTYLENQADKYITKGGKEATRKVREDKHVLVAAVYSWPESSDDFNLEEFQKFAEKSIEFFEKEHGIKCQSAVVHFDEEHPHVHVYGFHKDARSTHAGWVAKTEAKKNGASEKESNIAYKEAMKGYQDRYFEQVTSHFGMERLSDTPRKRLSRTAWKEQKALDKIIEQKTKIQEGLEHLTTSMATKEKDMHQQYQDKVESLKKQLEPLRAEVQKAKAAVQEITDFGGVRGWAMKMAYAVIGRERPELAEARKLLEEKTRKAAAAEAKAKREIEQAQAETQRLREVSSNARSEAQDLKRENKRLLQEAWVLKDKVSQTAEPAKKIELLQEKLKATEKELDWAFERGHELRSALENFADGKITKEELIETIRPKDSSSDFKM